MPTLAVSSALSAKQIPIQWNQGLSIYASEPFLRSVSNDYGWLGGFDSDGRLRCILPYTIVRKAILRMVRFRVETIPMEGPLSIEEERAFLNDAMRFFKKMGADLVIPATTNTIFRTHPDGAVAAPYGTYIVDLSVAEDAVFAGFNSSHRRKVRVAAKEGVRILSGVEYMRPAYDMVRDTFKRSNLGFMDFPAFERMMKSLGDQVRIFVAEQNNQIQACLVAPFSQPRAYYVYGGSIPQPAAGATVLMHWEAMRHFRSLGVQSYDFVGVRIDPAKGSKQEGLKDFKERFGGQLLQGYLWKYSFSALKFALYNMAARYRSGGDIVDQETQRRDEQETPAVAPAAPVPES